MLGDFKNLLKDEVTLNHLSKLIIDRLDNGRKGYLNKSEFKEFFEDVAEELETHISQLELDELFFEADLNSCMKIGHEEVRSILIQLLSFLSSDAITENL